MRAINGSRFFRRSHWLGVASVLVSSGVSASNPAPFPSPFDAGATYQRNLHVDAGAAAGGDGSERAPLQTIAAALAMAEPGTRIQVAAGIYGAVGTVTNLQGSAHAPIAVVGSGEVVIDPSGASSGMHLVDPRYVVIEGITIRNAVPHGMNIDDGGSYASPASHVVLRNMAFSQIGDGGNNDCLKMSGVDHFYVEGSRFVGCNQGEGIDMVGCHSGVITGNTFTDMPGTAVQTKGGSTDVLIHGNRFLRIGQRAISAGGSTGQRWLRPNDAAREAERIRSIANVIERTGSTPVVFTGCGDCVFANNTIVEPGDYVARIVEEHRTRLPGQNGYFINNVILFESRRLRDFVDIGEGTRPMTFTFGWNLWHALDDERFSGPTYGGGLPAEQRAVVTRDPQLDEWRRPRPDSLAIGAGRAVPGDLPGDFERRSYDSPPAIGAFARPSSTDARVP